MTVVGCTKCKKTFVLARKVKENDSVKCLFCGKSGFFAESTDLVFKGEGYI